MTNSLVTSGRLPTRASHATAAAASRPSPARPPHTRRHQGTQNPKRLPFNRGHAAGAAGICSPKLKLQPSDPNPTPIHGHHDDASIHRARRPDQYNDHVVWTTITVPAKAIRPETGICGISSTPRSSAPPCSLNCFRGRSTQRARRPLLPVSPQAQRRLSRHQHHQQVRRFPTHNRAVQLAPIWVNTISSRYHQHQHLDSLHTKGKHD